MGANSCAQVGESMSKNLQKYVAMGKAAFHRGLPCIPVMAGELMTNLRPGPVGANIEPMKAWHRGWTFESQKEPVA